MSAASATTRSNARSHPRLRIASSLAVAAVLATAPARADEDLPLPAAVEIQVFLDTVEASPGENASLLLSLLSSEPLRTLSVAIDFDESALQLVRVERVSSGGDDAAPPDALAGAVFDNVDGIAGNQTDEGFVHLQIDAGEDPEGLVPVGEITPLVVLEFVVLPDAPEGLSEIVFESVGPAPPEVGAPPIFDNEVVLAGGTPDVPAEAFDLAPENFDSGGVRIKIIGEIGFMRGDSNFDKMRDISDPVFTLAYLFLGSEDPACDDAADANDDGVLDVADPVYTLMRYYVEPHPFPAPHYCGRDPSPDALTCNRQISCEAFPTGR